MELRETALSQSPTYASDAGTAFDRAKAAATERLTPEVRKVALSSYLGNTLEYYDYLLYGSAAALVFGTVFFGRLSPAAATIASFATLAAGSVARPLGGVLFGYLGDRTGRKSVLMATMLLMGIASGLIGLLPTYDQIGIAAPILLVLLRLLQGLAVGGEWGGATLMAAEHSPPSRRGFVTSISQMGLSTGGLLAALAMAAVATLPPAQLFDWGWRIPFLLSFALFAVGLYVRTQISESPLYEEFARSKEKRRQPLSYLVGEQLGSLVRGILIVVPAVMIPTLFGTFGMTYAVSQGHARPIVLTALCVAWALCLPATLLFGRLTDRIGRRPLAMTCLFVFALVVYPCFLALQTKSVLLLYVVFITTFALLSSALTACLGSLLSEMFSTHARYSGVSICYQGGSVVAGFSPLVASALITGDNGIERLSMIITGIVLLAMLALWYTPERRGQHLDTH